RWSENASRNCPDIDWERAWLFIQRHWCDKCQHIERCKDGELRKVKAPAALLEALRAHRESSALEGSVKEWTPEQRGLVFPTEAGRIVRHGRFVESIWHPLLAKAGVPYRKYHPTPHTHST